MARFPIRLGPRSRPFLLIFGVRERNAYVDLTDDQVDVHFGFFRLRFPVASVVRWRIEGPWLWITAIGLRRGIRAGDITFAGNHHAGVRLDFREPLLWSFLRVPRFYVTVADLEAFTAALTRLGVPGEDARTAQ